MSNQPTEPATPPTDIIFGFGGRALRTINKDRLLRTGENIYNMAGQGLWELVGFHPKGVRVVHWPEGVHSDWSWESLYGFYERVPSEDKKGAEPELMKSKPA